MLLSATAMTLIGLVAWSLFLVILLAGMRGFKVMGGQKAMFDPSGADVPGFGQRLTRAYANCLENLPGQATILLYALLSAQTAVTDPMCMSLFVARIIQSSAHMISTSPFFIWIRFASYLVQVFILVYWILLLVGL